MSLLLPHLHGPSVDLPVLCVKLLILVAAVLLQVLRGRSFLASPNELDDLYLVEVFEGGLAPIPTPDNTPIQLHRNSVRLDLEFLEQFPHRGGGRHGPLFAIDFQLHCCLHAMYHNG